MHSCNKADCKTNDDFYRAYCPACDANHAAEFEREQEKFKRETKPSVSSSSYRAPKTHVSNNDDDDTFSTLVGAALVLSSIFDDSSSSSSYDSSSSFDTGGFSGGGGESGGGGASGDW